MNNELPSIDDTVIAWQLCACEFTPYSVANTEESWHFKRRCKKCNHAWYGLHCPHDGVQNPCPKCGVVPESVKETE